MEERIEPRTEICRRHRPLRRTRAVIGLLLLTTTNNSSCNSYSSGLAVEAFTTPQQRTISPSFTSRSSSSSSSLYASSRSNNNNNSNERGNNSKKRKSTELEVSQQTLHNQSWMQGEATYNDTLISSAELPRGFTFADDDEASAEESGYSSSEGQNYEVSDNLQGTISSSISSSSDTIATNGASEEYTINMSKYYINDDNYDGDHYDNMDHLVEIDGSLIGT